MRLFMTLLLISLSAVTAVAGTWVDDFEDGNLDGWTIVGGGEWIIKDGKLSGKFAVDFVPSVVHLAPSKWKDYTLEASVCLLEKFGNHPEMAFCTRLDPSTWNAYGFCLHFVDNNVEINRHSGLNAGGIQKLSSKFHPLLQNTWYNIKCFLSGNHISFYINDELCIEIDDNPGLESGTLAIYVSSVHVLVDDIFITGDDIPDHGLPQGSKSLESLGKLTATWASVKFK